MPKASDMMSKIYCKWNYSKRARYKIAIVMGKSAVLNDMFPGDQRRTIEMLIQYEMK